jgi:hypothetical protein
MRHEHQPAEVPSSSGQVTERGTVLGMMYNRHYLNIPSNRGGAQ